MFYDLDGSKSASSITCDCTSAYEETPLNLQLVCCVHMPYEDGSTTSGYYGSDLLQYEQPFENSQIKEVNAAIIFGCVSYLHQSNLWVCNGTWDASLTCDFDFSQMG